jgi:hypothetical protein
MRYLSALALVAAAGCQLHPQAALSGRPEFQRGISLGLFAHAEDVDYDEQLAELAGLGASDVALVITWVQDDVRASDVRADPAYTAPDELVRRLARRAHALGLRVTLFPILRLVHRTAAEWRGTIAPRELDRWFESYGARLSALAELARDEHVEVVSVGSELASTERAVDRWRALIAGVRARYPGRLLYSANWDHYREVPFWPLVDQLGISAYWAVAAPGRAPTVEEAVAAWRPIRDQLDRYGRALGRPIVLTEVGYQSVQGAGAFPWNDFLDGADGAESAEAQRRLYQAFTEAWTGDRALAGVYFWIWFARGGVGDRGYTPRRKPAELIVRAWFRAPERLPPPR